MNRREALNMVALLMGGTVVGGTAFLEGCKTSDKNAAGIPFSKETIALLDEISEIIIPTTDTPGAKAAQVGAFMNVMVQDCYEENDQKIFIDGIKAINVGSEKQFGKDFMNITADQRKELLTSIDKEAAAYVKDKKKKILIITSP